MHIKCLFCINYCAFEVTKEDIIIIIETFSKYYHSPPLNSLICLNWLKSCCVLCNDFVLRKKTIFGRRHVTFFYFVQLTWANIERQPVEFSIFYILFPFRISKCARTYLQRHEQTEIPWRHVVDSVCEVAVAALIRLLLAFDAVAGLSVCG